MRTLVGHYFPGQLEQSATDRLLVFVFDSTGRWSGAPSPRGIIDSLKMKRSTSWGASQIGGGFCATQLRAGSFHWPADLHSSGSTPRATADLDKYEWYDFDPGVVGPAVTQVALFRMKHAS